MTITTELPHDVQSGEILRWYANTPQVAVVVARPAMRSPLVPLMRDILAASTKGGILTGVPRNAKDAHAFGIGRLAGRQVHTLIVANAQLMSRDLLDHVHSVATHVGARLILAYDLGGYEALASWAGGHQIPDVDWGNAALPEPDRTPAAPRNPFPPAVPDVDFPLFRSVARQILDPTSFLEVDEAYCSAFQAAQAAPPHSHESALDLLKSLVADTDSVARVITLVRGVQAGSLTRGQLVLADMDQVQVAVTDGRHRHLRPEDLEIAWGFPDPQVGAVVALSDYGLGRQALERLTVADMPSFELPAPSMEFLRAHETVRRLQGAIDTDPAFIGTRAVSSALLAAGDHGIPTPVTRKRGGTADRWRDVFGLRVRALQ